MISHNNSTKELREDIAQRLEKLNKWQEEQKKLLQERQDMQRQMLGMEQRKLYEMLGIVHTNVELEAQVAAEENIKCASFKDENPNTLDSETAVEDLDESLTCATNTCTDAQRKTSGYCTDDLQGLELPELDQHLIPKVKRSFLRCGQGLKQRFKIDPDALRLNNLPRYKFANAHPQFLTALKKKKSANRKATKPKQEINDELPQKLENKLEIKNVMDPQEKRFQHVLISSHNTCYSTPDMKITQGTSSNSSGISHLPKVRFVEISATNSSQAQKELETKLSAEPSPVPPVTWAKVLDTQQIKPIQVQQLRNQCKPTAYVTQNEFDSNLSLFELLEQKANEGSVDMNSTCIRQFMLKKLDMEHHSEDVHKIPVQPSIQKTLLPIITAESSLGLSETEDERDVTGDTATEYENTLTPCKSVNSDKPQHQVRFCDDNTTNPNAEESNVSAAAETSSFNMFQQFKEALFAALQSKEETYNTTVSSNQSEIDLNQISPLKDSDPNLSSDLKVKMNLVKTRLTELEKEIACFKENNINLIRAKQEHELEKSQFAQERLEAMDKLNDAKIQMEIYLHDERMKIEDEKRKFERHMQMVKTAANNKDRKEIARLRQELEELQSQLKLKEQGHVAAQARLRAQIRNIEKDQKQLYDDIERLTKENKRLQNENMKINRENNNKMLQEINRNIAKLAPKLASTTSNSDMAISRPSETEVPVVKTTKGKPAKSIQKSKQTRFNINKSDKGKMSSALDNAGTSSDNNDECQQLKTKFSPKLYKSDSCDDDEDTDDFSTELKISESNSKIKNQPDTEKVIEANKSDIAAEFKREIVNSDGSKDIWYPNGNLKKISADGMTIRMLYFNKDIKETNINEGTVKYYYAETNTWHTTYLDGLEILEFPNGQTEHRYKNGVIEVHFPNNSIKITNPADEHKLEEWRFVDGTNLIQLRNGDKILMLPNGQKEIHTKLNKRREYPDGTVKIVYPDGSQETRYSNGRVRLKDKVGKLVMDTENAT